MPSIVQFGFLLLESVDGDDSKQRGDSAGLMSIEELSIMILMTLFEVHDISRNEVCLLGIFFLRILFAGHLLT